MLKMSTRVIALVTLAFMGCATTQQATLTDDEYDKVAATYAGAYQCGASGSMDPASASLGMTYAVSGLRGRSYDQSRLDWKVHQLKQQDNWPSKAECNQLAMTIQGRKQQIAINNENAASNQAAWDKVISNRPRQTYCIKDNIQVLCNTY